MSFIAVMDFISSVGAGADSYLPLRVEKDVDVIPDMDISITKLNKKGNSRFNHFFSNGYGGITFKVTVLIKYFVKREGKSKTYQKDTLIDVVKYKGKGEDYNLELTDMWNNKPVLEVLHDWYSNMTPLSVVTDAIDIPDGEYIITKNPSRKQHYKTSTEWELEFTTYTPLTLFKYRNDNSRVLKALKKNKAKKNSSKKNKNSLSKCNYKSLKYSKKKKVVKCVKTLQKILKKKKYYSGKVDGWFGKETTKAVRKFQKKYNKKHVKTKTISGTVKSGVFVTSNSKTGGATIVKPTGINKILPENGKVDKATFKQLVKL